MAAGKKYGLPIGNVFHAGDGNLHPLIMFDERDPEELERVHRLGTEILKICADLGGTISGEHGVGLEKLRETHFIFCGEDLDFERRLKDILDPTGHPEPRQDDSRPGLRGCRRSPEPHAGGGPKGTLPPFPR